MFGAEQALGFARLGEVLDVALAVEHAVVHDDGGRAFSPETDDSMNIGSNSFRFQDGFFSRTLYGADAPTTGWNTSFDDIVVGDGSGNTGISIWADPGSNAGLAFRISAGNARDGAIQYDGTDRKLQFVAENSIRMNMDADKLWPQSPGGLALGTPGNPWAAYHGRDHCRFDGSSAHTSNFTATRGRREPYDASGGGFTITAPASPNAGDRFAIKEVAGDATSVTIDGNASFIEDPIGGTTPSNFSFGVARASVEWEYDGSTWRVI